VPVVEFRILGSISARVDGRELPLGGPKQRGLLAILLLEANERVSRDRLIEGLWGESAPPSAEHTLDGYVSRLRKTLGRDRITRSSGGYVLRVEVGELDLVRFERLALEGHEQLAAGDAAASASSLAAALALWHGLPLADVLEQPFAAWESARLEERRLAVLEERIDADLAAGAASELVGELEALVREHPLRERLLASLMRALYRAGRQAAALEVFRSARRRFADELGIEPGPRLAQLERLILEHDPSLLAEPLAPARIRRRVRQTRRHAAAVLVLVGAVSGATVLVLLTRTHGGGQPRGAASARLSRLDVRTGRLVSVPQLSAAPASIAVGNGSLWIADTSGNDLLRANINTGAVTDRIPLTAQPGAVAVGAGSVWVASTTGSSVTRVDMTTDSVTQVTPVGGSVTTLAFVDGALWVGDAADDAVLRVEPRSGQVDQTVTVGVQPSAITAGAGLIWVAGYDTGTVVAVDPSSGAPVDSVHVGGGPTALAFAAGSLWVANRLDGTVSRVNPRNVHVAETLSTGSAPVALAAADGSVWVANQASGTITRIDTTRDSVSSTTPIGGRPTALTMAASTADKGASVWVGTLPPLRRRGGTLVLLQTRRFFSTDAQINYDLPPAQFLGLVNDGLVSFDHTAGPQGLQLVPDLALAIPTVADGGRSFTFRLRPAIRYSTGRLVQASDFARGVRRLFRVRSPGAGFFEVLVGGRRCLAHPSTCTLAQGVVANDSTRTVTFKLSTPDPDFLFKLATGFVIPVPPGTPMHDVGTHPIPGTGPYRLSEIGPRRITLLRNARFREWSAAAQPNGLPNRIEWRFGLTPDQEIAAVEQGRADWASDFGSDLAAILRNHKANVHSNVFPTLFFLQVNTNNPPFNDVRVRQALNYAVDRAVVTRLYGGLLANDPSCQTIPPGLPGYRRYCPYTLAPGQQGRWTAPNLRRARSLVAASRTRGAPVTIWDVSDTGRAEPIILYLARLLRTLGYRPRVRVVTSRQLQQAPFAIRAQVDLIPVSFGPDWPSPAETYSLFLSCGGPYNWNDFCDHTLDRKARQAEALRITDPRRSAAQWAAIDRQMVDRAVWVPLTSQRIVDVVSKRLRNYEFSPVYHFLPAQASLP
jgi:peptide/nickel transport system substrate-binding protein